MKKEREQKLKRELHLEAPWTIKVPTPVPNKNYWRHGLDITFVVIGNKGALSLTIYSQQRALKDEENSLLIGHKSMQTGLFFHYKHKKDSGEYSYKHDSCSWLKGKPCYCEDWGISGWDYIWENFIDNDEPTGKTEDVIFDELEKIYRENISKLKTKEDGK